jgi:hypothetical protein
VPPDPVPPESCEQPLHVSRERATNENNTIDERLIVL